LDLRELLAEIFELLLAADSARSRGTKFARCFVEAVLVELAAKGDRHPIWNPPRRLGATPTQVDQIAALRGQDLDRLDLAWLVDDSFAVEKPGREVFVVAGCSHGDRQRPSLDADFERLFHRHEILNRQSAVAKNVDSSYTDR